MLIVAVRILEALFAIGAVGSVLVLILTTIDDVKVLFGGDDEKAPVQDLNERAPSQRNDRMQAAAPARG
jgi:hypothetical protein